MQKGNVRTIAVTAVIITVLLLFSWQYLGTGSDEDDRSLAFAQAMTGGDAEEAYDLLSPEAREVLEYYGGIEYFEATMAAAQSSLEATYGPFAGIGETYEPQEGISCTIMEYAYSAVKLWTVDNGNGIDSFTTSPHELPSDDPVPDGITETPVQVGAEGMSALDGVLASSAGSDHTVAVVLVSGSGPNGMDYAFGDNRIFQQLAWGLAALGVDVLRYDDRTYAEPWNAAALGNALDIDYETVDDAVSAAALLKGMGYERVYVAGSSLGAIMAPAIVQESDGLYDGLISMAGSPRSLAEISYDQNMLIVDQMPDGAEKDEAIAYLDQQMALYDSLGSMTDEQLMSVTVFGMSGYYLRSIEDYDVASVALSLDVPMLFLQGTADWQITYSADFSAWMEVLDGKENVQSQLYLGLNHLFCIPGPYDGSSVDYYVSEMTVNQSVIQDIAGFVLSA